MIRRFRGFPNIEEKLVYMKFVVDSTITSSKKMYESRPSVFTLDELGVQEKSKAAQKHAVDVMKMYFTDNFVDSLAVDINSWVLSKEPILNNVNFTRLRQIKENLQRGGKEIDVQHYLKVAVKAEEQSEEEIHDSFVEWVQEFVSFVPDNLRSIKIELAKRSVVERYAGNLQKMLLFPVATKETRMQNLSIVTEKEMVDAFHRDYERVMPGGILRPKENIIVGSNVYKMIVNDKGSEKTAQYLEGRLKLDERTSSKQAGLMLDLTGEFFDDVADIEVADPEYINGILFNLTELSGEHMNKDVRIHKNYDARSLEEQLRKADLGAIRQVMRLLQSDNFYDAYSLMDSSKRKDVRNKLIYGVWVDMNLKILDASMESQLKTPLGMHLYKFNSPFAHNMKIYGEIKGNEMYQKAKERGLEIVFEYLTSVFKRAFEIKPLEFYTYK